MTSSDKKYGWKPAAAGFAMVLLAAISAAAQGGLPEAGAQAAQAAAGRDNVAADATPAPATASGSTVLPGQPATEAAAPPGETPARDAPAGVFSIIKTIGAVGLLLSLFLAAFLMLRKCAPRYFALRPAQKSLRLVESLSMGEKRSIAVIEVAGRVLLVGNTPNQITLLAFLGDEIFQQAAADAAPVRAAAANRRGRFVNLLVSQKGKASQEPARSATLPPDLRGKMRELRAALEG